MNNKNLNKLRKIIKTYYIVNRPITNEEIILEIKNLKRKEIKGNLDSIDTALWGKLQIKYSDLINIILNTNSAEMK